MPLSRLSIRGFRVPFCTAFALGVIMLPACSRQVASDRSIEKPSAPATKSTGISVSAKTNPASSPDSTPVAASLGSATVAELEALAENPSDAVGRGLQLMAQDPACAAEYGAVLTGALVRAGAFPEALEIAEHGPEGIRHEWMKMIFCDWVRTTPSEARIIADLLRQKNIGGTLYTDVVARWAATSPAEMACYAYDLPAGEHRSITLNLALERWIFRNPPEASAWISRLTQTDERDRAVALLVAQTDLVFRSTEQALTWAESIASPELRRTALSQVIREWFAQDPASASRYIETSPGFDAAARQQLLAALTPKPDAI